MNLSRKTILFVGLGSIGKRHLNIVSHKYPSYRIIALRSSHSSTPIKKVQNYYELEHALSENEIYAAFITNPTYLHVETAIELAKHGINLFIEKPLSNSLKDINTLKKLISSKNIVSYVAYNFRFNPIIRQLKSIIQQNAPTYCRVINTSYLPEWRKNTDYRKTYSAHKELGGNIVLDLSHELDYVNYFSPFHRLDIKINQLSSLEIDTGDNAEILFQTSTFSGVIHLNFSTMKWQRIIELYFDHFHITADLLKGAIDFYFPNRLRTRFLYKNYSLNQMYVDQIEYFFTLCKEQNVSGMNNINEASALLEMIINALKDAENT